MAKQLVEFLAVLVFLGTASRKLFSAFKVSNQASLSR